MIAGIPPLDLFGVRLTTERVDRHESFAAVRCEIESHRLQAVARVAMGPHEATALLEQIERQYADFAQPVAWSTALDSGELEVSWTLNANGHAQGRFALKNRPHWRVEGELDGDQSYLPKLALGLRLLLRAFRGEPL